MVERHLNRSADHDFKKVREWSEIEWIEFFVKSGIQAEVPSNVDLRRL
jgi:hypothetical protein